MLNCDYLVVGQGLAGTTIASVLEKQGADYLIVDNDHKGSSSVVAAGIVNPVVFKRNTTSWNVDKLLPVCIDFFRTEEEKLKEAFFEALDYYRLFSSYEDQNNWSAKSPEIPYFGTIINNTQDDIINDFGLGKLEQAYALDVSTYLKLSQEWLFMSAKIIHAKIDYSRIDLNKKRISTSSEEIEFNSIIFCEGFQNHLNPWFNYLPFKPVKGEILTIEFEKPINNTYSKGIFVKPVNNGNALVGSTYNWNDIDDIPSAKGKSELADKLAAITNAPYNVLDHKAGIIPTVKDRRPLLGQHPEIKNLYIFNGLGTKGVMIAPFYARQLVDFIIGDQQLDQEVDIDRFVK